MIMDRREFVRSVPVVMGAIMSVTAVTDDDGRSVSEDDVHSAYRNPSYSLPTSIEDDLIESFDALEKAMLRWRNE